MRQLPALLFVVSSLVVSGCARDEMGLSLEDELTLTAVQGEEEDLGPGGETDLAPGWRDGESGDAIDADRPVLFRVCDAGGSLDRLMERYDANADGSFDRAERSSAWDARGWRDRARGADRRGHRPGLWMVLFRVYDADADRDLGEVERAAMLDDFSIRCEALHERALDEFDADGDGELSEAERQGVRDAARERRGDRWDDMLQQYDADGDGELSRDEWAALAGARRGHREEVRSRCIAAFDADGDGDWNTAERAVFIDAMRERIRTGENLRCTE